MIELICVSYNANVRYGNLCDCSRKENSMPFINARVSVPVTKEQEEVLKDKLGKAISIIPGKSEQWLMIEFADCCNLYFQGNQSGPTAFIEVKVFGSIPESCLDELTEAICNIYETELHVKKDRIYVKYEEVGKWGWTGGNF